MSDFYDASNNAFSTLFMDVSSSGSGTILPTSAIGIVSGFEINGIDIGAKYVKYKNGLQVNKTGYISNGSDLSTILQSKNVSLKYDPSYTELPPTITTTSITYNFSFTNVKTYDISGGSYSQTGISGKNTSFTIKMSRTESPTAITPYILLHSSDQYGTALYYPLTNLSLNKSYPHQKEITSASQDISNMYAVTFSIVGVGGGGGSGCANYNTGQSFNGGGGGGGGSGGYIYTTSMHYIFMNDFTSAIITTGHEAIGGEGVTATSGNITKGNNGTTGSESSITCKFGDTIILSCIAYGGRFGYGSTNAGTNESDGGAGGSGGTTTTSSTASDIIYTDGVSGNQGVKNGGGLAPGGNGTTIGTYMYGSGGSGSTGSDAKTSQGGAGNLGYAQATAYYYTDSA